MCLLTTYVRVAGLTGAFVLHIVLGGNFPERDLAIQYTYVYIYIFIERIYIYIYIIDGWMDGWID